MSTWYCHACKRSIRHMGVPRHRRMHKDHGDVFEMTSETHRYSYDYSNKPTVLDSDHG